MMRSFSRSYSSLKASKLTISKTLQPKTKVEKEKLTFGTFTSDHMLEADWTDGDGWSAPKIIPYQPLALDPASSVFHYGLGAFEGMKAYLDSGNRIRLFRPEMNMKRLNDSAARIALPQFDGPEYLKCIEELVRIEKPWIPQGEGFSLYLRPLMVSTYAHVGVAPPKAAKLLTICCPVGPYYATGFKPVKLLADPAKIRAWPGGTGNHKVGGNYAMGMATQKAVAADGYGTLLWLYGNDHEITECGTMNQFFFWIRPDGKRELVTPPLSGTILPGVTRDSILALARTWGEFEVSERVITMADVTSAVKQNRMLEAFGAGTAAIVSPVNCIHYEGVDYPIPLDPNDKSQPIGPLTKRFSSSLLAIQYGRVEHPWSKVID